MPPPKLLLFAVQHLLTLSAVWVFPVLIGITLGLATGDVTRMIQASFLLAGVVTVLQSSRIVRLPIVQGPTAAWLKSHLYVAAPVSTFERHQDLYKQYTAAYPDAKNPSGGVLLGIGMADIMNQALDAACESGDLTRAGVLKAFQGLKNIDTGGLLVPIDAFTLHRSPSLQSFVYRPADVDGGAKVVQDAFEGEFAEKLAGS